MPEKIISVDTTELDRLATRLIQLGGNLTSKALKRAVQRIIDKLEELMLKPTSQWRHNVPTRKKVTASRRVARGVLSVEDEAYFYVTMGTRPHAIIPVNGAALAFNWAGKGSYSAKSKPNSLSSFSGGSSGGKVFFQFVFHPGIQARNFHIEAGKAIAKAAPRIVAEEIVKLIKTL